MLERLQKIISRAGIASRRHAEELITAGQVRVNGEVVTELGSKADPETDHIEVAGKLATIPAETSYYMMHKPVHVVSTMSDPEGRATLRHLLRGLTGVYPVGRLDYASSGLLLLTSDGEFANRMFKSSNSMPQTYWIKVKGHLDEELLRKIRHSAHAHLRLLSAPGAAKKDADNPWYEVELAEASRDLIRRELFAAEHPVEKMKRVKLGPLDLGDLPEATYRKLESADITRLKQAVERAENAPHTVRTDKRDAPGIRKFQRLREAPKPERPAPLPIAPDVPETEADTRWNRPQPPTPWSRPQPGGNTPWSRPQPSAGRTGDRPQAGANSSWKPPESSSYAGNRPNQSGGFAGKRPPQGRGYAGNRPKPGGSFAGTRPPQGPGFPAGPKPGGSFTGSRPPQSSGFAGRPKPAGSFGGKRPPQGPGFSGPPKPGGGFAGNRPSGKPWNGPKPGGSFRGNRPPVAGFEGRPKPRGSFAGGRPKSSGSFDRNRPRPGGSFAGNRPPQGSGFAGRPKPSGSFAGNRPPQGSGFSGRPKPGGSFAENRPPQGSNFSGPPKSGSNYAGNRPNTSGGFAGKKPRPGGFSGKPQKPGGGSKPRRPKTETGSTWRPRYKDKA